MATATLAITANPTCLDAGRVLGIVCGPRAPDEPAGSQRWTLTRDLNALSRPDSEFLPCEDITGARERLEARFPSPHPELTRVGTLPPASRYSRKQQRFIDLKPDTFVVFPIPWLAHVFVGSGGYSSDGHETVTRLLDLAAAHGPFLVARESADLLRTLEVFDTSDLVMAQESGCHYATVKFAPAKSQARRTRATNTASKQAESFALANAAARMRARIDDLSRAIRQDFDALGLTAALPEFVDSHRADDWEPVAYESHRRGWRGQWSGSCYAASKPSRRGALEILVALGVIHSRFRGQFAYRRFPAWETLRSEFRTLPPALDSGRWGLYSGRPDLQSFWSREMHARRPRPVPAESLFGCGVCGFEAPGTAFGRTPNRRCPRCGGEPILSLAQAVPYAAEVGGREMGE